MGEKYWNPHIRGVPERRLLKAGEMLRKLQKLRKFQSQLFNLTGRDEAKTHLKVVLAHFIIMEYKGILYIKVNLCEFVCVSGIEIHTVGPILTKFGMGA